MTARNARYMSFGAIVVWVSVFFAYMILFWVCQLPANEIGPVIVETNVSTPPAFHGVSAAATSQRMLENEIVGPESIAFINGKKIMIFFEHLRSRVGSQ